MAQFNVGVAYMKGEGIEKSEKNAIEWLSKVINFTNQASSLLSDNSYNKDFAPLENKVTTEREATVKNLDHKLLKEF